MKSHVRLYVILARRAPVGVVFRRGPTKQVLLIAWNTNDDTLESGQWLKGRIYERRCDLSPEGDLLLYFAASYRKPLYSWSAISRPPYLTALALWPKGDGWGGGGHFLSHTRIALNHRSSEMALGQGFSLPRRLAVQQFGDHPGWGEDDPIWSERLRRDGWILIDEGKLAKREWKAKVWIEFNPARRFRKPHPALPHRYALEMAILGLKEKDGPWYLTEHFIVRYKDATESIGRSDWADWSHSGDLLFAQDGCLFRVRRRGDVLASLDTKVKIADLSSLAFEAREAPEEARNWPAK
jgi:hypothetical protein